MYPHRTVALLVLATALIAGVGGAATTEAPSAVQVENTTIDDSGEAVTLVTESDATVTGETGLEPGTDLTVVIRSSGENPFLLSNQTTVGNNGRFVATFDLSDTSDGGDATVSVRSGGDELAETEAHLVARATATASPTPTVTDSPTPNGTSSGDGPGFGALVAFLAVLGTALAGARRA